jgi:hypothetical protein
VLDQLSTEEERLLAQLFQALRLMPCGHDRLVLQRQAELDAQQGQQADLGRLRGGRRAAGLCRRAPGPATLANVLALRGQPFLEILRGAFLGLVQPGLVALQPGAVPVRRRVAARADVDLHLAGRAQGQPVALHLERRIQSQLLEALAQSASTTRRAPGRPACRCRATADWPGSRAEHAPAWAAACTGRPGPVVPELQRLAGVLRTMKRAGPPLRHSSGKASASASGWRRADPQAKSCMPIRFDRSSDSGRSGRPRLALGRARWPGAASRARAGAQAAVPQRIHMHRGTSSGSSRTPARRPCR